VNGAQLTRPEKEGSCCCDDAAGAAGAAGCGACWPAASFEAQMRARSAHGAVRDRGEAILGGVAGGKRLGVCGGCFVLQGAGTLM